MATETVAWIIVVVLFFLGYAGLFLPVLPDYPLVLIGFAVYHFLINSEELRWFFWVVALLVGVVLFAIDYIASSVAVRHKGGSKFGMVAAFIGILLFPLFLGPLGMIVGPFVMVVLVEYAQNKNMNEALEIGYSTLVGFIGGVFVKFLVMTGMICWFVLLHVL